MSRSRRRARDGLLRAILRATRAVVAAVVGVCVGALLALVAAVRRAKAVHPHGEVYSAQLVVAGGEPSLGEAALFARPQTLTALVRFSRSLGLPRPLPDLLGISIRVLDAYGADRHQDFLLVSSVDRPVLNRLFVPARDVQGRPYSSSLPYRAGDRRFLVGVLPHAASPRPAGATELDRARLAAATGRMRFHLAVAAPMGRLRPVAELRVGRPLPEGADALRFSPLNSGEGLEPVGVVNAMRRYAYPMSQWTWGRTRRHGRRVQRDAELLSRRAAP